MRKAVFFDLDGTIIDVTHKRPLPAEAVRTAIHRLQEAGHYAFVATGRPYRGCSTSASTASCS